MKKGNFYIQIHSRNKTIIEKFVIIEIDKSFHFGYQIFSQTGEFITQSFIEKDLQPNVSRALLNELNKIPKELRLTMSK